MDLIVQIAEELKVRPRQVEEAVRLFDAGNTIPFIARYRKEATGELDEEQLRKVDARMTYLRNLEVRKEEIKASLIELEKITPELETAITAAVTLQELEDIYRPYRPKRKTRATVAKERGLEPLAQALREMTEQQAEIMAIAEGFVDPERGVGSAQEALNGAMDIIAEDLADQAEIRKAAKEKLWREAKIKAELKDDSSDEAKAFLMYRDYAEEIRRIPPHRILAINRGEKLNLLKVGLEVDLESLTGMVEERAILTPDSAAAPYLRQAVRDSVKRLLFPSLERELRAALTERSETQAIKIFGINLRHLLLQPPIKERRVMGIDPGFRTGSKVAVIDETGKLLDTVTIYPHPPHNKKEESLAVLGELIRKHSIELISIGNGTASRETELLIAELLQEFGEKTAYCIVSEAGASVYSASPLARKEFPELDVSMRGAVSIARRLIDPLSELVKIEPRSIGVGQYQHDVNEKDLESQLSAVVESAVNYVGVDLNTASPALLQYVSGIGPSLAQKIVAYREKNGKFTERRLLKKVSGLGEVAFTQSAGFIRVPESTNPLDNTPVHPESYPAAEALLESLGYHLEDLRDRERLQQLREDLKGLNLAEAAGRFGIGVPTLRDIAEALGRPGRDPREELPPPILRQDVLHLEDLYEGMVLRGTVRNVVDFGAFIDLGVKQDGLVHISEISDEFVRHPADKLAVGDIVSVRVLSVDRERQRIALSMKNMPKEG
ncbi:MAG TPA: Tex family protein [Bacillota bacterium]|nr:Tex family protein [Bacillota bacterium]